MSDIGLLYYYLDIEVAQGDGGISIKQTVYAKKVLEQFTIIECNSTKYPMEPRTKLHKNGEGHQKDAMK